MKKWLWVASFICPAASYASTSSYQIPREIYPSLTATIRVLPCTQEMDPPGYGHGGLEKSVGGLTCSKFTRLTPTSETRQYRCSLASEIDAKAIYDALTKVIPVDVTPARFVGSRTIEKSVGGLTCKQTSLTGVVVRPGGPRPPARYTCTLAAVKDEAQ